MLRPLLIALALAPALGPAPARAQEPAPPPPDAVALDAGWEFRFDPADAGRREGWQRPGSTDPGAWTSGIELPHAIAPEPLDRNFGGTVAWYRLRFEAPAEPGDRAWAIHFGQIRRAGEAWLNGRPVGIVTDGYSAQEFPALGLMPGAENELVVRVDSRRRSSLREGWWNWGGLLRGASLRPLGAVRLADAAILPRLDCRRARGCRAAVIVDGVLENRTSAFVSPTVGVDLDPPGPGARATRFSTGVAALRPGERRAIRFTVAVEGAPTLWAPERPALYSGAVSVRAGGRTEDVYRQRVGLRSVSVRRGRLLLNGSRVALRGASIQEDVKGRGAALTAADNDRIVSDLKDIGADVTRAHYVLSDDLLSKLDAAGILVWSQAPVYHRDALLRSASERSRALAQVRRAVIEARRHPSVLTHSVANELSPRPDSLPGTRAFMTRAAKEVRALDPSVPVSVDLLPYPGFRFQRTHAAFDLLGINAYFGWYRGKRRHSTASIFDLAPYLRAMRRRYPRQALVITEFGAEALRGGPVTQKGSYAFQSDYVRRVLDVVDAAGFIDGAIYWTLAEFAVKPRWDGGVRDPGAAVDPIHNKGLIDYEGGKKPAWAVAKERFERTELYR